MITCNLGSLLALGSLITAYNYLGSFSFKCYTQLTHFNYKLGFAFLLASLTFSLAFFLMCFNLFIVIFCIFAYISSLASLSRTASSLTTLKNPDLGPYLKNC